MVVAVVAAGLFAFVRSKRAGRHQRFTDEVVSVAPMGALPVLAPGITTTTGGHAGGNLAAGTIVESPLVISRNDGALHERL